MKDLLLLKLRNAIANKEWIITCANMETARGGWTCAWDKEIHKAESEIQFIMADLTGVVMEQIQLP